MSLDTMLDVFANTLTVLAASNDPDRADTERFRAADEWFAERLAFLEWGCVGVTWALKSRKAYLERGKMCRPR